MSPPSSSTAAAVALAAMGCASLALAACDAVPLACGADADCPADFVCSAAVCRPAATGIDDAGPGGAVDAGPGDAGPGDSGPGDAGSADAGAGEGEGEGDAGPPPASCADVLLADPSAPSGSYTVVVGDAEVDVQCDMDPAHDGGGFALLYTYDVGQPCPGAWIASANGGCERAVDAEPGSSAFTPAPPYPYREVRGSVRALGFGGSDAFRDQGPTIDDAYVDGFTIDVGTPRNHVFSFAHACSDTFGSCPNGTCCCPCAGGAAPPAFVGANFRCEAPAASFNPVDGSRFYDVNDVLFDGADITPDSCIGAPDSAPDFHVDLGAVHTEPLELRLLQTEPSNNENTEVTHLDLWVR